MLPSADIDRIVQEVVRRLREAAAPGTPIGSVGSVGASEAPAPNSSPAMSGGSGTLTLPLALISVEQLSGRLESVEELVAPVRAVLTPSAKDLLRERGVRVRRCSELAARAAHANAPSHLRPKPGGVGSGESTRRPWLLCDGEPSTSVRHALNATAIPAGRFWQGDLVCLPAQLERLAGAIAGDVAVLVTRRGFLATAAANRHACLRAALIRSTDDLSAAADQLEANVLVVDTLLPSLVRQSIAFAGMAPTAGPDSPSAWLQQRGSS